MSYGTHNPGPSKTNGLTSPHHANMIWDLVANAEWAPAQLTDHQQFVNCATSPFVNLSLGCRLQEESFWRFWRSGELFLFQTRTLSHTHDIFFLFFTFFFFFLHSYSRYTVLFRSRWRESMHASWEFLFVPQHISGKDPTSKIFISLLAISWS